MASHRYFPFLSIKFMPGAMFIVTVSLAIEMNIFVVRTFYCIKIIYAAQGLQSICFFCAITLCGLRSNIVHFRFWYHVVDFTAFMISLYFLSNWF